MDTPGPPDAELSVPADASPDEELADEAPRPPRDNWKRLCFVVVVLSLTGGVMSLLSVHNAPRLSLLDESTHIDYTWRAAHLELPRSGQPFSEFTLDRWSCRGQAQVPVPACGSDAPHEEYPNAGVQYNAFHPPVYYAVTGVVARSLAAVTGQDFLTAARAVGALWLVSAMIALYLTLRYWRVAWGYALGGALVLPLVPAVLHASSVVTNDAPAALAGVGAVFVLGRVLVHRNLGWILPGVLAAAAASTKVMNAMALIVVAIVIAVVALVGARGRGFRAALPLLRVSVVMLAAVGVVYVGWEVVHTSRALPGFESPIAGQSTLPIDGLPFDEWLPTLVSGLPLGDNYYLDPAVSTPYIPPWVTVLSTLMAATSLLALASFELRSPRWIAGATLLVGCLVYPLAVQTQAMLGGQDYFRAVPTRYGISLVPLAAGLLAMLAERWQLRRTAAVFLGSGTAVMLTAAAGLGA